MTASTAPLDQGSMFADPFWLLALAGLLFTVVGGFEVGSQLIPFALGSPEWEFGTYCSVMDTLPQFLLGLGLLSAWAVTAGKRPLAKTLGVLFLLLAFLNLAGAFLFATNVPQVLKIHPHSVIQVGIKKAVLKASLQSAVYPFALLWLGQYMLRNSPGSRKGRGG
jgi:hypothetical protein